MNKHGSGKCPFLTRATKDERKKEAGKKKGTRKERKKRDFWSGIGRRLI